MLNLVERNNLTTHCLDTKKQDKINLANRFVFQGVKASPMFEMESSIDLPQLKDGEILVKVKAATICLSDIHTVCGNRTEPTPR